MCIINTTHKFIFVHVPKCAGTTVSAYLSAYSRYCDIELGATALGEAMQALYARRHGLSKHSPARTIRAVVGPEFYSNCFTFSLVRDPLSRLVSTYHFLKFDYRDWDGSAVMDKFRSLSDFVASSYWSDDPGPDNMFMEQAFWLNGAPQGREVIVDYVGKVESYDSALATIVSRAKLPPIDMTSKQYEIIAGVGRENASTYGVSLTHRRAGRALWRFFGLKYDPVSHARSRISLPDKDRERIARRYAIDYELFGYALPGEKEPSVARPSRVR
jgi:hypothetical protein